ncbi:MAG: hypothetical protein HN576_13335 [Bacteriovoracaceae bacterium]|nr:hypothetical protein [Bacteriovoracaceae bacterium]
MFKTKVLIILIMISYLGPCYSGGEDSSSTVIDQTCEGHTNEQHELFKQAGSFGEPLCKFKKVKKLDSCKTTIKCTLDTQVIRIEKWVIDEFATTELNGKASWVNRKLINGAVWDFLRKNDEKLIGDESINEIMALLKTHGYNTVVMRAKSVSSKYIKGYTGQGAEDLKEGEVATCSGPSTFIDSTDDEDLVVNLILKKMENGKIVVMRLADGGKVPTFVDTKGVDVAPLLCEVEVLK